MAKKQFESPGHYTKGDREQIPAEDFAGPDRTYPIVTQADVHDAAGLVGHAADPAAVKARIIAIAKRKGFALPDTWSESKRAAVAETVADDATETRAAVTDPALVEQIYVAPITRVDPDKRLVTVTATSESVDSFGTVFDYDASKEAFQRWVGNVREMHQPKAVGTRVAVHCDDAERKIDVTLRVSKGAQDTWEKVLDGTLKGASIGASNVFWEHGRAGGSAAAVPRAKKYSLVELSLVDNPSNPDCANIAVMRNAVPDAVLLDPVDDQPTEETRMQDAEDAPTTTTPTNLEPLVSGQSTTVDLGPLETAASRAATTATSAATPAATPEAAALAAVAEDIRASRKAGGSGKSAYLDKVAASAERLALEEEVRLAGDRAEAALPPLAVGEDYGSYAAKVANARGAAEQRVLIAQRERQRQRQADTARNAAIIPTTAVQSDATDAGSGQSAGGVGDPLASQAELHDLENAAAVKLAGADAVHDDEHTHADGSRHRHPHAHTGLHEHDHSARSAAAADEERAGMSGNAAMVDLGSRPMGSAGEGMDSLQAIPANSGRHVHAHAHSNSFDAHQHAHDHQHADGTRHAHPHAHQHDHHDHHGELRAAGAMGSAHNHEHGHDHDHMHTYRAGVALDTALVTAETLRAGAGAASAAAHFSATTSGGKADGYSAQSKQHPVSGSAQKSGDAESALEKFGPAAVGHPVSYNPETVEQTGFGVPGFAADHAAAIPPSPDLPGQGDLALDASLQHDLSDAPAPSSGPVPAVSGLAPAGIAPGTGAASAIPGEDRPTPRVATADDTAPALVAATGAAEEPVDQTVSRSAADGQYDADGDHDGDEDADEAAEAKSGASSAKDREEPAPAVAKAKQPSAPQRAVAEPNESRVGARISAESRTALHGARDQMASSLTSICQHCGCAQCQAHLEALAAAAESDAANPERAQEAVRRFAEGRVLAALVERTVAAETSRLTALIAQQQALLERMAARFDDLDLTLADFQRHSREQVAQVTRSVPTSQSLSTLVEQVVARAVEPVSQRLEADASHGEDLRADVARISETVERIALQPAAGMSAGPVLGMADKLLPLDMRSLASAAGGSGAGLGGDVSPAEEIAALTRAAQGLSNPAAQTEIATRIMALQQQQQQAQRRR